MTAGSSWPSIPQAVAKGPVIKPILKHTRSHDVVADRTMSIFVLINLYTTSRMKNRPNNWTARLAA